MSASENTKSSETPEATKNDKETTEITETTETTVAEPSTTEEQNITTAQENSEENSPKSENIKEEETKEENENNEIKEETEQAEENSCKQQEEETPVPEGHHKLQTSWTFFYNNKKHSKDTAYKESLIKLNAFNTVEGFWNAYTHLKRPEALPKDANLYLFRNGCYPMWEDFEKGGCWNLCVAKVPGRLSRLWELLLMGVIGELFEEPDVIGVILSRRSKEDVLSVWNANHQLRLKIGDKLKKILQVPPNTPIDYKYHTKSIKDRSTYRNGRTYIGSLTNPSAKKLQLAAAKQAAAKQAKAKAQANANKQANNKSSRSGKGKGQRNNRPQGKGKAKAS